MNITELDCSPAPLLKLIAKIDHACVLTLTALHVSHAKGYKVARVDYACVLTLSALHLSHAKGYKIARVDYA